jgi:predicted metal-dependent HD superfamily phosphohydrolase
MGGAPAVTPPRAGPERWAELWRRLGARGESGAAYDRVVAAYAEPARHYHTLAHIADVLGELDGVWPLAERRGALEAAAWLHDVVYDPHASDNEEQSARWAASLLVAAGVPATVCGRIGMLILATRHDAVPDDADSRLLADADLAILGRPAEEFDAYERAIREEYAWVPEPIFRARRAEILEGFLSRDSIYTTPSFRSRYEWTARENLGRSVKMRGR